MIINLAKIDFGGVAKGGGGEAVLIPLVVNSSNIDQMHTASIYGADGFESVRIFGYDVDESYNTLNDTLGGWSPEPEPGGNPFVNHKYSREDDPTFSISFHDGVVDVHLGESLKNDVGAIFDEDNYTNFQTYENPGSSDARYEAIITGDMGSIPQVVIQVSEDMSSVALLASWMRIGLQIK